MLCQISNLRKTKAEEMYMFTAVLFVGEAGWLLVPGFRIFKGSIWPPSRKAGNYWPRTIHMSEDLVIALVEAATQEAGKFNIPIDREKAIKSLRADPVDLLILASDIMPDDAREKAEEELAGRKARKAEREKPLEVPKRKILSL